MGIGLPPVLMTRFVLIAATAVLVIGCASTSSRPESGTVESSPLFREAATEAGLDFQHFTGSTGKYYLTEIMGAGVALFDYDGDGDLDVYLLQGVMLEPGKTVSDARFPPPKEHWPGNRLYQNQLVPEGKLSFRDVTEGSGLGYEGYGMGAAVGDIEGDGDLDLYVTNFGSNVLFRNDGGGKFSDITRAAGVDDPRWSSSAAFVDYDRDGDLDLFAANYIDFTVRNNKECFDPTGARDYCTPTAYRPVPDKLFRNDGNGKFTDVSSAAGLGAAYGNGLGVTCADFNGDGWIDISVANDGTANQLWINQQNGKFLDDALMSGTAYNADGVAEAGMGVTAGDVDGDGSEDLFMTHLTAETNTLWVNNGKGQFHDSTTRFGLAAMSFPYTGFGSEFFDYDSDGILDIFVANGAVTIMESLRGEPYPFHQKNQLVRGYGDRFEDVSAQAGPAFELSEVSRGAAFGDIDQDGDVDIVVSNNNGPARLLLNEAGAKNHWLAVELEGVESNREGIGARVAVLRTGEKPLWRRAHRDGSYLSANDVAVHFGLGQKAEMEGVGVVWPNGRRELFRGIKAGSRATLREGTGGEWPASSQHGN